MLPSISAAKSRRNNNHCLPINATRKTRPCRSAEGAKNRVTFADLANPPPATTTHAKDHATILPKHEASSSTSSLSSSFGFGCLRTSSSCSDEAEVRGRGMRRRPSLLKKRYSSEEFGFGVAELESFIAERSEERRRESMACLAFDVDEEGTRARGSDSFVHSQSISVPPGHRSLGSHHQPSPVVPSEDLYHSDSLRAVKLTASLARSHSTSSSLALNGSVPPGMARRKAARLHRTLSRRGRVISSNQLSTASSRLRYGSPQRGSSPPPRPGTASSSLSCTSTPTTSTARTPQCPQAHPSFLHKPVRPVKARRPFSTKAHTPKAEYTAYPLAIVPITTPTDEEIRTHAVATQALTQVLEDLSDMDAALCPLRDINVSSTGVLVTNEKTSKPHSFVPFRLLEDVSQHALRTPPLPQLTSSKTIVILTCRKAASDPCHFECHVLAFQATKEAKKFVNMLHPAKKSHASAAHLKPLPTITIQPSIMDGWDEASSPRSCHSDTIPDALKVS